MADENKKTTEQAIDRDEIIMSQTLDAVYDKALSDMEAVCASRSRTVITVNDSTYYRAVSMREIHKCMETLKKTKGDPEKEVLRKPYTMQEIKDRVDRDGYVSGVIHVPFDFIIERGVVSFLDFLSMKLVDSDRLMDISYEIIGVTHTRSGYPDIIMKVIGNVDEIIAADE